VVKTIKLLVRGASKQGGAQPLMTEAQYCQGPEHKQYLAFLICRKNALSSPTDPQLSLAQKRVGLAQLLVLISKQSAIRCLYAHRLSLVDVAPLHLSLRLL
jgi:hypothetical protein